MTFDDNEIAHINYMFECFGDDETMTCERATIDEIREIINIACFDHDDEYRDEMICRERDVNVIMDEIVMSHRIMIKMMSVSS